MIKAYIATNEHGDVLLGTIHVFENHTEYLACHSLSAACTMHESGVDRDNIKWHHLRHAGWMISPIDIVFETDKKERCLCPHS